MNSNRREFLARAATVAGGIAGAVALSGRAKAQNKTIPGAESWNPDKGIRKKDEKLLNIGGVFGLYNHTSSTWWRYLNPPEGYVRSTGMRITHLWCLDKEAGKRFAERYDAKLVPEYDDMIGKVDGMLIDDFFATPYMPDFAVPYLEAGIPCYFDRPMASSMKGAMQVINASKRSNTPFMVASAYEYLKEVEVVHYRLKQIGEIQAYEARNSGSTIYQYALHGLWFALKCIGVDVERIGCVAEKAVGGPSLTSIVHRRDDRIFYGTMHQAPLKNHMCSIHPFGKDGDFDVTTQVDGRPWYKDIFTYIEMLHAFERTIRTNELPETYEYTEAKMRIFLTILKSHFYDNGKLLEVASLPMSWDAGPPKNMTRSYSEEILDIVRKALKK